MRDDVLSSFTAASTESDRQLRGSTMNVEIAAQVPRLEKSAHLLGIRAVSNQGSVTYSALELTGDSAVRREIIARYLAAEQNAGGQRDFSLLALTPANYKFRYLGMQTIEGTSAYLFSVKPRKKREGSFEGSLWIDARTTLPLRESGRVVQHSIFLRRLTLVRKFRIIDRTAIAESTAIEIDTRLVGKARMTVNLSALPAPQQQGKLTGSPEMDPPTATQ